MTIDFADIKEMTVEQLQQEVLELRTKYVWGLQVSDIASCIQQDDVVDVDETLKKNLALLKDEDLNERLLEQLDEVEDFAIYDWAEDVHESISEFSKETRALLFEFQKREFSRPRGED